MNENLGVKPQISTLTGSVLFQGWDNSKGLGSKTVTANTTQIKNFVTSNAANFTGAVTLNNVTYAKNTYTANGSLNANKTYHVLNASNAACVMTLAPKAGHMYVINCANANNTVTVTLANATFDGANNVATFNAAEDSLIAFAASNTTVPVLGNVSVTLSA